MHLQVLLVLIASAMMLTMAPTTHAADAATVCTISADCSNHAASVSGNTATACACSCRNAWSGASCATCANNYDITQDCGVCAVGYAGYPSCARMCTVALDCKNHAGSVSGTHATGCSCSCRNAWSGASCSTCANNYDSTQDCGVCEVGYENYPSCTPRGHPANRMCTIAADCKNHAGSVSGNTATGCACSCRNAWSGASCATCANNYDSTQDCGVCAVGYAGYPSCARMCTVALDCNNRAGWVGGTIATGCACSCLNAWSGASCATCANKYDSTQNCGACAVGYENYPSCDSSQRKDRKASPFDNIIPGVSAHSFGALLIGLLIFLVGSLSLVYTLRRRRVMAPVAGKVQLQHDWNDPLVVDGTNGAGGVNGQAAVEIDENRN